MAAKQLFLALTVVALLAGGSKGYGVKGGNHGGISGSFSSSHASSSASAFSSSSSFSGSVDGVGFDNDIITGLKNAAKASSGAVANAGAFSGAHAGAVASASAQAGLGGNSNTANSGAFASNAGGGSSGTSGTSGCSSGSCLSDKYNSGQGYNSGNAGSYDSTNVGSGSGTQTSGTSCSGGSCGSNTPFGSVGGSVNIQNQPGGSYQTIDTSGDYKSSGGTCSTCKGPFPGPNGSILESKPAPIGGGGPSISTSYEKSPISGYNIHGGSTNVVGNFPGPSGSISQGKPGAGHAPAIIGHIPGGFAASGSTSGANSAHGTIGISGDLISSFPGSPGDINKGVPVSSGGCGSGAGSSSCGFGAAGSSHNSGYGSHSSTSTGGTGYATGSVSIQSHPGTAYKPITAGQFPGPSGSILDSKPATSGSISGSGTNYVIPSHGGTGTSCSGGSCGSKISSSGTVSGQGGSYQHGGSHTSLPGPIGSIHDSKPVVTGTISGSGTNYVAGSCSGGSCGGTYSPVPNVGTPCIGDSCGSQAPVGSAGTSIDIQGQPGAGGSYSTGISHTSLPGPVGSILDSKPVVSGTVGGSGTNYISGSCSGGSCGGTYSPVPNVGTPCIGGSCGSNVPVGTSTNTQGQQDGSYGGAHTSLPGPSGSILDSKPAVSGTISGSGTNYVSGSCSGASCGGTNTVTSCSGASCGSQPSSGIATGSVNIQSQPGSSYEPIDISSGSQTSGGCTSCKGPLPGPNGSIHDSKPAISSDIGIPKTQNVGTTCTGSLCGVASSSQASAGASVPFGQAPGGSHCKGPFCGTGNADSVTKKGQEPLPLSPGSLDSNSDSGSITSSYGKHKSGGIYHTTYNTKPDSGSSGDKVKPVSEDSGSGTLTGPGTGSLPLEELKPPYDSSAIVFMDTSGSGSGFDSSYNHKTSGAISGSHTGSVVYDSSNNKGTSSSGCASGNCDTNSDTYVVSGGSLNPYKESGSDKKGCSGASCSIGSSGATNSGFGFGTGGSFSHGSSGVQKEGCSGSSCNSGSSGSGASSGHSGFGYSGSYQNIGSTGCASGSCGNSGSYNSGTSDTSNPGNSYAFGGSSSFSSSGAGSTGFGGTTGCSTGLCGGYDGSKGGSFNGAFGPAHFGFNIKGGHGEGGLGFLNKLLGSAGFGGALSKADASSGAVSGAGASSGAYANSGSFGGGSSFAGASASAHAGSYGR